METIFSYGFITRAFVVGIMISVCAAVLGVVLVLKRYSMIGDGLSHISFGALALATVFGVAPLKIAIPVVTVASVILLRLNSKKIKGDSLIAIISSSSLALGIALISYSGSSADMNSY
ncbi:MAG: metal ABC transporter permease, partial [Clostridia bacterium]|nr:metal ABC transporter permease [Clostridia bacterium]